MQTATIDEFTKALEDTQEQPQEAPERPQTVKQTQADDYTQRKARAILYVSNVPGGKEGERNHDGYGLTARLREKFDLNDVDLLDVVKIWNDKNTPPLDDFELSDIVKNADKYAKRPAGSGYEPMKHQKKRATSTSEEIFDTLPLVRLSDVQAEAVSWLWLNRFPNKSINLLPGQGSVGKTTFAAYLMAKLSSRKKRNDKPSLLMPLKDTKELNALWAERRPLMPKLTEQQKRFAESYMRTFDAGKAAIEAGYSEASAPSQGSKLLRKTQVSAYIDQLSADIQEKTEVEVAEIIQALRKIAFAAPSQKISTSDRLRALELLGKTVALFTERYALEDNEAKPKPMTAEERADWVEISKIKMAAECKGMSIVEYLKEYQNRYIVS